MQSNCSERKRGKEVGGTICSLVCPAHLYQQPVQECSKSAGCEVWMDYKTISSQGPFSHFSVTFMWSMVHISCWRCCCWHWNADVHISIFPLEGWATKNQMASKKNPPKTFKVPKQLLNTLKWDYRGPVKFLFHSCVVYVGVFFSELKKYYFFINSNYGGEFFFLFLQHFSKTVKGLD